MVFAGVLAGGVGSRMGNYNIPKQFLTINDKPIIVHVVEKFLIHNEVDMVIVGINPAWYQTMLDIQKKFLSHFSNLVVVKGGADRNETIDAVIKEARKHSQDEDDIIVTHDAVRPFVTLKMISDNIEAAKQYGVCDTVIPATDTIVCSENNSFITDIPDRSKMYQGQTPQSFRISLFEEVYASMTEEELKIVTDACKMFMLKGHNVQLVEGHVSNIKITYPYDYKVAQIMMENMNND